LALGGNVGNSQAILDGAVALLCDGKDVRLIARSSDYRTPPWGFKYQPPFVNLAIVVETTLGPRELLARAQQVELRLGRDRAHEKRNGPRTADIDIIAYNDVTMSEPNLRLPPPRLFERAFVLVPLAEIAGDRVIAGRRVAEAAKAIDAGGIHRMPSTRQGRHAACFDAMARSCRLCHFARMTDEMLFATEFPPTSEAEWRRLDETPLQGVAFDKRPVGRDYDGPMVEPL